MPSKIKRRIRTFKLKMKDASACLLLLTFPVAFSRVSDALLEFGTGIEIEHPFV